ncbi:AT hook motif protein [Paecilomyces variotii No. 5]|uniref:AT hook motif protein n=1 Tax=Byssochlamys spectabilis (strain No. 5 / NBRC 109023) TaxID=1356009 RepID=V5FJH3_BYSSN|nr:AT hook motif protein [Paecilomyces variotii No. 5]
MPMTWNAEADARLLIAIIAVGNPKMDYDKLSEFMGGDCTAYAIQHRIRKLKDKANGKSSGSTPNTPSKRKKRSDTKTTEDAENGAVDQVTPKKIKTEPAEDYNNETV